MNDPGFMMIGLGGAGGKIVDAVAGNTDGAIRAVAIDTDFNAISRLARCQQIRIGATRFDGAGSGGDRSGAGMAADETPALAGVFENVRIAAVVAGLGKGTGSGVLPKILEAAAERNVATIVFMVVPFAFEGTEIGRKAAEAEQASAHLGDVRVVCRNDDLCPTDDDTTLDDAFSGATGTLADGITLLWKLMAIPGYINIDPAALLSVVRSGRGSCSLGVGVASGPDRIDDALDALLGGKGLGIGGRLASAKAALVGIIGGEDLRLAEVSRAMTAISAALPMDTQIRMGTVLDKTLEDSLRIVVLLFREWNPLYASETDEHDDDEAREAFETGRSGSRYSTGRVSRAKTEKSTYNNRFDSLTATSRNGENLDKPTYLRRKLHIDLT
ncbi:MAG: hypothetical protein ACOX9C_09755 [Kiritimatiellia bacterium]|jgi:cell division protein FtsZ